MKGVTSLGERCGARTGAGCLLLGEFFGVFFCVKLGMGWNRGVDRGISLNIVEYHIILYQVHPGNLTVRP